MTENAITWLITGYIWHEFKYSRLLSELNKLAIFFMCRLNLFEHVHPLTWTSILTFIIFIILQHHSNFFSKACLCFLYIYSVALGSAGATKSFHKAAAEYSVEMHGVAVLLCLPHRTGEVYLQKHHMIIFELASVLSSVSVWPSPPGPHLYL